jgi:hypothetical protein
MSAGLFGIGMSMKWERRLNQSTLFDVAPQEPLIEIVGQGPLQHTVHGQNLTYSRFIMTFFTDDLGEIL